MNFCRDCQDILVDPVEWRYGYCLICLTIHLEKLDREIMDLWYGDECDTI